MSAEDEKKSAKGGAKSKVGVKVAEKGVVGPRVKEGEHVFGVAHIYASFNDTFIVIEIIFYIYDHIFCFCEMKKNKLIAFYLIAACD